MIYNDFMNMALMEAQQANCAKGKVGAVIVLNWIDNGMNENLQEI